MEISLIEKAVKIASVAHAGQTRKDKETQYIVHPFMVAFILEKYGFSDTIIAAALTHDVLEDSDFGEEKLRRELGDTVVDIVKAVSEDKSLPWEDRKKLYTEVVGRSQAEVKAVSLADKIHNIKSILNSYEIIGPDVWKSFNRGREQQIEFMNNMLKMFKETWSHPMVDEYETLVKKVTALD